MHIQTVELFFFNLSWVAADHLIEPAEIRRRRRRRRGHDLPPLLLLHRLRPRPPLPAAGVEASHPRKDHTGTKVEKNTKTCQNVYE